MCHPCVRKPIYVLTNATTKTIPNVVRKVLPSRKHQQLSSSSFSSGTFTLNRSFMTASKGLRHTSHVSRFSAGFLEYHVWAHVRCASRDLHRQPRDTGDSPVGLSTCKHTQHEASRTSTTWSRIGFNSILYSLSGDINTVLLRHKEFKTT